MNTNLVNNLIKTRNILKKKYKNILLGEIANDEMLEKTFKPISKPLKEIVQSTNNNNNTIKHEKYPDNSFKHDLENNKVAFSTPYKKSKLDYNTFSPSFDNKKIEKSSNTFKSFDGENNVDEYDDDNVDNNDNNSVDNDDDDDNTIAIQPDQSIQYDLSKVHLNIYDKTYGPRKDKKNQIWRLGNEPITFNSTNITVGNSKWPFTSGLYELLVYKKPISYNKTDLNNYKQILEMTNVYKRNNSINGQIKGNRSTKYTKIIKNLFKQQTIHKGKGLMKLNRKKVNYVYWDDPNELVDRLRLLISSTTAGHSNHNNEIVSIIEELREAKIII